MINNPVSKSADMQSNSTGSFNICFYFVLVKSIKTALCRWYMIAIISLVPFFLVLVQVVGTGVLGITGACAPRPVTRVGSGGSVCVKAQESRVTLAMALERKCALVMTRSAQVCVHDQNIFFLFPLGSFSFSSLLIFSTLISFTKPLALKANYLYASIMCRGLWPMLLYILIVNIL